MRLVLLRHADAEADEGRPDFERRLSAEGRGQAVGIGTVLAARGVHPDLIVSSPANRALSTVVLAAPAMGYPIDRIVADAAVYEATLNALLGVVHRHGGTAQCLVLAGHNPGLRQLGIALADLDLDWAMPKGHAALFSVERPWAQLAAGGAQFEALLEP